MSSRNYIPSIACFLLLRLALTYMSSVNLLMASISTTLCPNSPSPITKSLRMSKNPQQLINPMRLARMTRSQE